MSATVTSMRRTTATVSYICCGGRLEHVALDSPGSTLSFTHCSSCMVTRWYRGDQPTDPGDALELPKPEAASTKAAKPSRQTGDTAPEKAAVSRGGSSAASAGPRS